MAEDQGAAGGSGETAESSSVLLVSGQYATSEDCSSTIDRQVAQTLTGAGRKVYSTVLEDTEEDRKCAEADGVELILPTCSQEDPRKPCPEWLTYDHLIRYPRLPQDVGWIVGHAGVTSRAAATIKEQRFPQASLSLVTQTIPEDTEKYKEEEKAMGIGEKEDSIRQDAENADTVFSVGHRILDHFTNTFRAIPNDKRPAHYLFLPKPSDLFQNTTVEYFETSEKVVLLIGRVTTVERVKGFDLAVKALSKVVERSQDRIKLRIRSVSKEEYEASMDILQTSINSGKLIPTLLPHGTQEDICRDMQQSHLVLMPSRAEPFGLVGLEAMAAGVPVLISDQSGLATLIKKVVPEFHHSVLRITGDDSVDVRRWADQIADVLRMSEAEFRRAAELKQKLLESRYWEESHQQFLQAFEGAGDHDVHIEVQLRGPEMARLYAEASRQGSLPVHSTRVPVVGQFRSGKTCFIKRLMGETVIEKEVEPITDGIHIISDVQSKTWKKSPEEIDDLAAPLLRTKKSAKPSAEEENKDVDMTETLQQETETEPSQQEIETEPSQQVTEEAPGDTVEDDNKQDTSPAQQETNVVPIQKSKGQKSKPDLPSKQQASETPTIPEHLRESAERMLNAGITKEELGTVDHPRLFFWDFGGQAAYYGTHHCFITYRGVYILVMSLEQKLSDPVPEQDSRASVDNLRTGGDYLDHWLNTVRSHTLQHETREPEGKQSSSQDKTSRGTGRPPVVIVLTHKDKVSQEYIEKYKEEIRSHIKGKGAGRLVMPEIFAVDNTTEDAAVDEIRDYIRQVAKGLPHMGEEIPIPWLHLKSRLRKKREEGPFCKFREVAELARDPDINITDEHTLALVLTFLHDRGDIIFFDEPSLRDDVTLQPQVLINVFKTIITVPRYQQDRQEDPEMWERLEQKGVLSDKLLTSIWKKKDQQLEKSFLLQHMTFLKALMEKFYLICNATPVVDASDEAQQEEIYFVPALLSCERDNAMLYPDNMHICPQALYFEFSEKFLPSGMFSRLQALCVRRFGLQESCVFAGCARFSTDDEEQAFVITKVNHYLKVELLSSSNIFTEGLRVRKFLSSALFEIKEKWIPCIQYELCCSTQEDKGGEPAFQPLPTEYRSLEELEGIPSMFRAVWMPDGLQCNRTANSGGDGPVILQPTGDPSSIVGMRTIGPVLDTMELGGGLTLGQCDHIRNQLTPIQRVLDMRRQGEVDPYQLGASIEMCLPEFVDLFSRKKRGKELAILHADDYTDEFVVPLQTAARESGVPCHTEVITSTDIITEKTVDLLLNTNNRMVALVISPQTLHHKHWSNLAYEFTVRNEKLLLPILLYPQGSRDRMVRVLQQRSPVLCSLAREEIEMEGRTVSEEKLQEIILKVMTDEEKDFQFILESIFSRLDETEVRKLLRVWSARSGQQEGAGIERPQDLMRAMVKSRYITTGDLGMLERDMMAAGISFPVIVRDIPGVYKRSYAAEPSDSGLSTPTLASQSEFLVMKSKKSRQSDDTPGPSGIRMGSWTKGDSSKMKGPSRKRSRDSASTPLPAVTTKKPKKLESRQTGDAAGPSRIRVDSGGTDARLYQVSRAVGEEWTRLGQELGLEKAVLDNIEREDDTQAAFQMLKAWRTKTPHGPLHYLPQLEGTLQNIGRPDLAAAVQETYKEYRDGLPWTELDPDTNDNKNWSLHLPGEGKYLCRRTDLGVVTPYPLHMTYRSANWSDYSWPQEPEWMAVGPLFSIQCEDVEGPVDILLPHVLYLTENTEITREDLQVVHVVGDSPELLPVTELTSYHAVTRFKKGSEFGVVGDRERVSSVSRNCLLMAFRSLDDSDLSTLKVYIVSNSKVMQKNLKKVEKKWNFQACDYKICQLTPGDFCYLKGSVTNGTSKEVKISPERLKFEDTLNNNIYYESFRVEVTADIWMNNTSRLHLELLKETTDEDEGTQPLSELTLGRYKRSQAAEGVDSGLSTPTELEPVRRQLELALRAGPASNPVVLMLNDEYGTAKGGISTIHRQMARFLASKGARVYSTVLNATSEDKEDAKVDKVELIFPKISKGDPSKPGLDWLTWNHRTYYPDLPSVDFIVGHVNITSRAAKQINKDRLPHAKLVQVTHVIPEKVEHYKGEGRESSIEEKMKPILEDLKAADVIVSVGPLLYDYYEKALKGKKCHEQFLPEPSDIFKNADVTYVNTETKVVLSIGRVKGVERLKGYDLAGMTMVKVMEHLPNTIWRVCGVNREDFSESKAIIQANIEKGKITFTPLQYCTQKELCEQMEGADVVLMPSREEPFGLVGLEAIAAGVPVLVSHKSGLAKFLKKQDPMFDRTIVEIEDDDDEAAKTLAKCIIKMLKDGPREFEAAQSLKKKLLESNYWAASHTKFLEIFGL